MSQPLISIILPVFNGQSFLAEAIESCLNQTYVNIELIIVNDCSTDDTLEISRRYARIDHRIRVITNKENRKLPASLNIGHRAANGDFFTWTSDDNIYQKNALGRMVEGLIRKEVDFVYSNYLLMNDKGEITGVSNLKDIENLLFYGVVGACFLYKKEVYFRNSGYNENLFLVEDQDFWLRALRHSTWHKIDDPGLYFYRYHTESLSMKINSDPVVKVRFVKNLAMLYEKFFMSYDLHNQKLIVDFLINRYSNGAYHDASPLRKAYFFRDLNLIASSLNGFSPEKLNRIIFRDAVEAIMRNRKYQTISTLASVHYVGQKKILELPINRYLALIKKCLF